MAKSTFLANMSHELRTPLNAILGFAQLMKHHDNLNPQQQNFIGIINRSGNHLLSLINDVLEVSKIEAGKIVLTEENFNLKQLLQSLDEMLQIRAVDKQINLEFELDPQLPSHIYGDEGKLRQVLINLLGNAIKFTNSGLVKLRAQLLQQIDNQVILKFAVEDTGTGIAEEDLSLLFDPFVQAGESNHKNQGTGLGLTISRQFINLMGGEIQVTSQIGKGSCFFFQIAATLSDEIPPRATLLPTKRVKSLLNREQPCRILIVDDTHENCHLLQCLLEPVGFELRIAQEGETAIALWESWQPHLIWMDMRMPGMDGYEATRQIRLREKSLNRATKPTVIIALTASAFEEQRSMILETGCNDLVYKPFVESLIFEKLTAYLGVEYLYESSEVDSLNGSVPAPKPINQTVVGLNNLPAPLQEQLRQSALAVDGEQIMALLQENIPENQSLITSVSQ
ncbi:MAG: ATP-binding protein, partial [Microcystaceae cyanobacterium]